MCQGRVVEWHFSQEYAEPDGVADMSHGEQKFPGLSNLFFNKFATIIRIYFLEIVPAVYMTGFGSLSGIRKQWKRMIPMVTTLFRPKF